MEFAKFAGWTFFWTLVGAAIGAAIGGAIESKRRRPE